MQHKIMQTAVTMHMQSFINHDKSTPATKEIEKMSMDGGHLNPATRLNKEKDVADIFYIVYLCVCL